MKWFKWLMSWFQFGDETVVVHKRGPYKKKIDGRKTLANRKINSERVKAWHRKKKQGQEAEKRTLAIEARKRRRWSPEMRERQSALIKARFAAKRHAAQAAAGNVIPVNLNGAEPMPVETQG